MPSRTDNDTGRGVEIRLLGAPALVSAGQSYCIGPRKAVALLAYLAMRRDEPIARDHLAGLLWGESSNVQARANLRQVLTRLRRVFQGSGVQPIKTPSDKVMLCSDGLRIDAHYLMHADSLRGDDCPHCDLEFLEGFSLPEPEFERWLTMQRESLRSRVRKLHEVSAEDAFQARRIDEAIDHLTCALGLDPLQEHLHRRLMRMFAAERRWDSAMAQFAHCRSALEQELGIEPDKETTALYEEVKNQRDRVACGPVAAPPAMVSDKPSIAVMAFENMSGDPQQAYFSDGVVEDIITDLSKIAGLFVIARNSTFAYKGKQIDVREVCRELGVRYVLEGSVRRAAGRVRIAAQLIDGASGGHLWAERYDCELNHIFTAQDEITREIVAALALELSARERARILRRATRSLSAYEHVPSGAGSARFETRRPRTARRGGCWRRPSRWTRGSRSLSRTCRVTTSLPT